MDAPCNRDPALETYVKAVRDDIHRATNSVPVHQTHDNLTSTERKALLSLRSMFNIVIKPADKGSITVVMSRQDYLDKVMSHLQNEEYYLKLDEEPTSNYGKEIMCFLTEMTDRQAIDKETFKYIRPQDPWTSRFYILPKIHKEGNPGRPIVSSCGAPTERISQCIDHHLHSLIVKRIPSCVKDTTDFLLKVQFVRVPPGSPLLTLDVSALYTNIPHEEGIKDCKKLLNTRDVLEPPTEDFIKLVTLILNRNNFSFNNEHYIQKRKAMGTHVTPSYANIFMDELERRIFANMDRAPTTWWRYIDDTFAIWPHGEEHMTTFLDWINNFHPSMEFTTEWSYTSVTFLDTKVTFLNTKVTIDDDGRLVTDLYIKPTNTNQYLHRCSCHPSHCKHGISYSQAHRMCRICSRTENYLQQVNKLKGHLINRGYDKDEVHTQIDKATRLNRSTSLQSTKDKTPLDRVLLIVTYHPGLPPFKSILIKMYPSLTSHIY